MAGDIEYLETQARLHARAVSIIVEALTQRSVGLPEVVADPLAVAILARLAREEILLATPDELKDTPSE